MLPTSIQTQPRCRFVGTLSSGGLVRLFTSHPRLLQGLTWRRIAYTVLVTAAFALWSAFGNWMRFRYGFKPQPVGIGDFFFSRWWGWLTLFQANLGLFFCQMLALTVADNLRIRWVPRPVILVAGFILGTAAGSAFVIKSGSYLDWPPLWGLTWGGLVAFVYFKRRRDEELAAALHATKLAQVELKHKALESELQLMQAHVEPQFLFNTLRRVGDLYETDRPSAERMLENLIGYLRAALPQMRTTSSTLGREVELAASYLNIERSCRDDRFDFSFDVPERLGSTTFPPMVMLPLIEALAPRRQDGSDYDGALRAEARLNGGKLEVVLSHVGVGHASPAECADIGSRLAALYGENGKLDIEILKPRGTIARVSVPYVATA